MFNQIVLNVFSFDEKVSSLLFSIHFIILFQDFQLLNLYTQ
jgi:hypothetical protein